MAYLVAHIHCVKFSNEIRKIPRRERGKQSCVLHLFKLRPSSSKNTSFRLSVRPCVRLSVRPSVTPFWQCSCHRIILKFSEVTIDRCDVHAKGQGQRSKVKVTGVMTPISRLRTVTPVWIHQWLLNDAKSLMLHRRGALCFSMSSVKFQGHTGQKSSIWTQIGRFRTLTPVWIHQWLWNDAESLKQHSRGALLFFKVIRQISRWHGTKNADFDPNRAFRTVTPVWIHQWPWNDAESLKQHKRGALLFFKVICQISRSHGTKKHNRFWAELSVSGL